VMSWEEALNIQTAANGPTQGLVAVAEEQAKRTWEAAQRAAPGDVALRAALEAIVARHPDPSDDANHPAVAIARAALAHAPQAAGTDVEAVAGIIHKWNVAHPMKLLGPEHEQSLARAITRARDGGA
jgi:hypothetical protein